MRYIVMVVLMALTCLDRGVAQAVTENDRGSLRGLPGVQVVIENIAKDAEEDGLSGDTIRTAVELILRSSGIQVLTKEERIATLTAAGLYVKAYTTKNNAGLYGYHIGVSLRQRVSLLPSPKNTMYAPTWERQIGGTVGARYIKTIVEDIEEIVKAFANDFLAVNPR